MSNQLEAEAKINSNPCQPLSMRFARKKDNTEIAQIPYDPSTQMSIYGGDTKKLIESAHRTTTYLSASTGPFPRTDDDSRTDD